MNALTMMENPSYYIFQQISSNLFIFLCAFAMKFSGGEIDLPLFMERSDGADESDLFCLSLLVKHMQNNYHR